MNRPSRVGPAKVVVIVSAALLAVSAFTFGSALASNRGAAALPCRDGGPSCISIGFTDAWLGGHTVQLGTRTRSSVRSRRTAWRTPTVKQVRKQESRPERPGGERDVRARCPSGSHPGGTRCAVRFVDAASTSPARSTCLG